MLLLGLKMGKMRYCLIFCLVLLVGLSSAEAPVADFTANVTSGIAPLSVAFTDLSSNNPTGYAWYFGDEDFSEDWTQQSSGAEWAARYGHSSVVMPDGSIVLMGGAEYWDLRNDVWRSTDNGITWTQVNTNAGWTPRFGHTSVVMPDGSIVLMGGITYYGTLMNDVWRSADNGATWTQITPAAEWPGRNSHSSVVLPDSSIVLMGGELGRGAYGNDVWRSTDNGTTWKKVNTFADWMPRCGHSSVAMPDGSIVLMGGSDGGIIYYSDAWRSADNGATWTQINASPGWTPRSGHSSVVMPDGSIVLMGGMGSDGSINDVWRLNPIGSSLKSPIHTYNTMGIFPVALQVYNTDGYNSTRKPGYITLPVGYVDLSLTEFSAIGQSDVIDGISIYWEVENTGTVGYVGNRFDAVYLSTDQNLDSGDIKLSSFTMDRSLIPGESYSISEIIDYSNPVQDGMYYLILKVDDQNDVLEKNEQNNVIFRPLQIGSAEKFYENDAYHSSLNEDLKSQNLTSETVLVTGDLSGTITLPSVELVTISSGSFKGQGLFKGIFTANLDSFEYSGNLKGVIAPDAENDKILLKGTISGSEMTGLFEGILTESAPGSGEYDHFTAEWKLNKVRGNIVSTTLYLDGYLSIVDEHTYSLVPLTVIQTSMEGATFGDYDETISAVLTHLHISDPSNPFNGRGFSTLSYSSAMGIGQGWTYDTVVGSDFIDMKGSFTSPLEGVVSGTLTINTPRTLSIFLERIDLGLPTLPDLVVSISGPQQVSPGQTVDYVIEVRNGGVAAANDVIIVDALPRDIQYIASSSWGTYRWENHEVFWKFNTFAPRSLKYVYVRGYVPWGLSGGLQLNHTVYAETTGDERDTYPEKKTAVCDLNQYRTYQPSDEISIVSLSLEENENIRNTQNYQDILAYGLNLGYIDTNTSSRMIMTDGSQVTLSLLLSPDPVEKPEIVFITKFTDSTGTSTDWFLYQFANTSIALFDREGGITFNFTDGTSSYLGNWGEMHSCPRGACRANCYWKELGLATIGCMEIKGPVGEFIGKSFGVVTTSIDCIKCKNLPPGLDRKESCSRCTIDVIGAFPGTKVPGCIASLLFETTRCELVCRNPGTSGEYNCNPGDSRTRCSRWWNIPDLWSGLSGETLGLRSAVTEECTSDCVWKADRPPSYCSDRYEKCDCMTNAEGISECDCDNPNKGETTSTITPARDPNIKYGPEGHILAGQTLDYRIEYENVGEGTAFGVYFIDTLDEDLDASSLTIGPVYSTADDSQIAPPGSYNPATRTITWLAGEVGPKAGGYANISVKVRSDAADDTEIINFGIVYFPSVPEETRTNAIVSVVGINHPPAVPTNPTPADNDINIIKTTGLFWKGGDLDGDTLRYDVYFGNTMPLQLLERDTFSPNSNPSNLADATTYSWQVIARDPDGAETSSPVWHFTVRTGQFDAQPDIAIIKTANPTSVPETGGDVEFTIVVTNNGLEDATIDSLTDTELNLVASCPDAVGTVLGNGETYTCVFTEFIDGDFESGVSHESTATVVASNSGGNSDTESDDATVDFIDIDPAIDVDKLVSVDGGLTWFNGDSPTGPFVMEGAPVQFKFVVTNHGTIDLSSISLIDSDFVLAGCTIPQTLATGSSFDCVISTTAATGQHTDTASVAGSFTDGAGSIESDRDTDDANYYGIMQGKPSIQIESLSISINPTRTTVAGQFAITDQSTDAPHADGYLVALTTYDVLWQVKSATKQSKYTPVKPSGDCTYAIVSVDYPQIAGWMSGDPIIFDEDFNIEYTCTFSSTQLPKGGMLKGTAYSSIFGRTDKEFTYSNTATISK
jgi:uncharacterized repeat protein (TIGR01451 family)